MAQNGQIDVNRFTEEKAALNEVLIYHKRVRSKGRLTNQFYLTKVVFKLPVHGVDPPRHPQRNDYCWLFQFEALYSKYTPNTAEIACHFFVHGIKFTNPFRSPNDVA